MIYIYDILLNFNSDFYDFYEWEKSDYVIHIKKIPLYKVDTTFIEDLLSKKIVIDSFIPLEIQNKTEVFEGKKIRYLKYACLFTDSYRVLAVLLNDDFSVSKVSDLLLDESFDTLNISKRCNLSSITYNIVGSKKDYSLLTRKEIKIRKYLLNEIKKSYEKKDLNKLKYLYFEYYKELEDNIEKIYLDLKNSLSSEVNEKHLNLYELVKLSNFKKNVSI